MQMAVGKGQMASAAPMAVHARLMLHNAVVQTVVLLRPATAVLMVNLVQILTHLMPRSAAGMDTVLLQTGRDLFAVRLAMSVTPVSIVVLAIPTLSAAATLRVPPT
jgi:hypothetical protein